MAAPFIVTALLTFLAWPLAVVVSLSINDAVTHSASVWLSTGVTFGAVLAVAAPRRSAVLLGAGVAAFLLSLRDGMGVLPALGFGLNEAVSVALGAWLAGRLRSTADGAPAAPGKAYAGLLLGGFLTAALGASVALMLWNWALPGKTDLVVEWRVWCATNFVGILLMAPLILSFSGFRVRRSGGMGTAQFAAGGVAFLLFGVVATLIFSGDVSDRFGASLGPTFTYLPLPFMVITAILWKERGATLATLLGALALIAWTNSGVGPFAEVEGFKGEAVIEVQAYVAVMALLVGVVNALGATAAQALTQAQDWRARYRQVLDSNRTVVASFDAVTGRARWGEGASELLRTPVAALLTVNDLIAHADPAEQPGLRADWHDLAQGQREHVLWKTTLRWSDGKVVSLDTRLSGVRGADGRIEQVAALLEVDAPHDR